MVTMVRSRRSIKDVVLSKNRIKAFLSDVLIGAVSFRRKDGSVPTDQPKGLISSIEWCKLGANQYYETCVGRN